jgi:HEPN domain-containing protein
MSPPDDALMLLAIVHRHLRSLRLGLDPAYPEEDWGFTAQQAVEKILKAWIVLANHRVPRTHDLADLIELAGVHLDEELLALQVFAVEARYQEGPFPLPAERQVVLDAIERQLRRCSEAIADAAAKRPPS